MEGMMLPFPIAWNGLIETRAGKGQTDYINKVFGSNLDTSDLNKVNSVIKCITGSRRILVELMKPMYAFDNDEKIGIWLRIFTISISVKSAG